MKITFDMGSPMNQLLIATHRNYNLKSNGICSSISRKNLSAKDMQYYIVNLSKKKKELVLDPPASTRTVLFPNS